MNWYENKYDSNTNKVNSKFRTLTINGELDRSIIRSAQSFLKQFIKVQRCNAHSIIEYTKLLNLDLVNKHPMTVIKGMNGMQFADGKIKDTPKHIYDSELHAEIDTLAAHSEVANIIAKFILKEDMTDFVEDAFLLYQYLVDSIIREGNSNVFNICKGNEKPEAHNCMDQNLTILDAQTHLI